MQKCVSICKYESLSQISRWYSEIIKYNCCSRYGTNCFCNLLARAGCAQCASFAIIHSLGFIGRNYAEMLFQLSRGQWSNTMKQSGDTKCCEHSFIRDSIHSCQRRLHCPRGQAQGRRNPGVRG